MKEELQNRYISCFRAGAIAALRECVMLSHESNDNVCLHFAQAWLRRLDEDEKVAFIICPRAFIQFQFVK